MVLYLAPIAPELKYYLSPFNLTALTYKTLSALSLK